MGPVSTVALAESPAQLVNAAEWAATHDPDTTLVTLGPEPARTRYQMHQVAAELTAAGLTHQWSEVRGPGPIRAAALAQLVAQVSRAGTVVIGDPYSGIIQAALAARPRPPRIVVVDDGTATLRYSEQWATSAELRRWHLPTQPRGARLLAPRIAGLLGQRSPHVELFTAMPVPAPHPPATELTYAWTRDHFGPPQLLAGVDLMGSSLVETGMVDREAYLAGVHRLVDERAVRRYLPHRAEEAAKVAAIAALGVQIVRPAWPMEWHARRGPIGRHILSFPSTVLHTLPLVLAGTGVQVEAISIDDDWFTGAADHRARAFVHQI